MPFPQGGDFPRDVDNSFKVLKSDRRICQNDNGSNVCDAGHKLKFPGTCFNQPTGAFNSTDATFQPTFTVCTSDYTSTGFNPGVVFIVPEVDGSGTVFGRDFELIQDQPLFQLLSAVSSELPVPMLLATVEGAIIASIVEAIYTGTIAEQSVDREYTSFYRMLQLNPGVIPHLPGVYSDLFVYDVVASVAEYAKAAYFALEATTSRIQQEDEIVFNRNIVQRVATVSGSESICKGDEAPPYITYIDPVASGTVLRPTNQIVDFTLSDAPGGVDISGLYVSLNSVTSGTLQLVSAGADVTGGRVSITGDSSSYRVRYIPNFTWNYNDRVVVTISGVDLAPILGGNPFYCGAAGVNLFYGDITFKVQTPDNLGASISAIGDTAAPHIVSHSPASGTVGNDVFSPVVIVLADDLTGIELSTLTIVVDSVTIVFEGLATSSEVSITGLPSQYTITHNRTNAFTYGSSVVVSIYAEDKATPSPNVLNTSYSFSFIDDGTLRIVNFTPAVGTTVNPDAIDIEVDVIDDTYDVDDAQSFLVINGTIVAANITPITSGIHFNYHPPNDFAYDRPIVVKVHGVNGNILAPVVKESIYTLYYGQKILLHNGGPYKHDEQVDVFVHARNVERLHKDLSTGYFFTSYTQPRSDIGAYVEAITPYTDMHASLTPQGPAHRYGQTITVTFYVEDYGGHALGPYTYTYTIEES